MRRFWPLLISCLALACEGGESDEFGRMASPSSAGSGRAQLLGPFLDAHWLLPIPPQGPPPPGYSAAETSLDPAMCGACHPAQYHEWSTSLHAGAFSPGFAGQLVEGALAAPHEVRTCQTCHAPLAEQQPFGADLAPQPYFDPGLRERGLVCAACHVRAHRRFGPPRRRGAPPPLDPAPHGGFEARPEFQQSRFCAPCHQFFDDPGVNGKPLENTFVEWQASPHAAQGRTCQSCHMPDRAHLWRGIHDADTVRSAVDVELVSLDGADRTLPAALLLRSRDVGHAFPTYVTPRVFLAVWQEDGQGQEISETRTEAVIGRQIDFSSNPHREEFDTRVQPGETVRLDYTQVRRPDAETLVARVTVDPDFHYRGLFANLLPTLRDPTARAQIQEAYRRTTESSYVLSEIRKPFD